MDYLDYIIEKVSAPLPDVSRRDIRPGTKEDMMKVIDTFTACEKEYVNSPTVLTEIIFIAYFRSTIPVAFIQLIHSKKEFLKPDDNPLSINIGIKRDFRSTNIGSRLLKEAENYVRDSAIYSYLRYKVNRNNSASIKFASKNGFKQVHADEEYWIYTKTPK